MAHFLSVSSSFSVVVFFNTFPDQLDKVVGFNNKKKDKDHVCKFIVKESENNISVKSF